MTDPCSHSVNNVTRIVMFKILRRSSSLQNITTIIFDACFFFRQTARRNKIRREKKNVTSHKSNCKNLRGRGAPPTEEEIFLINSLCSKVNWLRPDFDNFPYCCMLIHCFFFFFCYFINIYALTSINHLQLNVNGAKLYT